MNGEGRGKVKEAFGKAMGESEVESERKVRNAVGGVKDALRGK